MPIIPSVSYHQGNVWATVMKVKGKERNEIEYVKDRTIFTPHHDVHETVQNEFVKQIVRQDLGNSVNNQNNIYKRIKTTAPSQSQLRVRY